MKNVKYLLVIPGLIGLGFLLARSQPGVQVPTQMAYAQSLDRGFADLVKKVGAGVVNISTYVRPPTYSRGQGNLGNEEMFRRFFEEFFGGQMPRGQRPPQGDSDEDGDAQTPQGPRAGKPQPYALGTGFIIDDSGLILTNHHVIGGAEEVKIQLKGNDELYPAEIVGRDPDLDVALLKVKIGTKLTALPLGDSEKIDVGEYVLAIGNPLGYGHTVTHGILSAKERISPELKIGKYLQTDASINPGNSGGPMINMRGEVIGINNAIDARGQGIGFAIPINLVKNVLPQLKTKGSVSRGYLGVSVGALSPEMAEQLHLPAATKGVMIVEAVKGQPADKAGLRPYDVITEVNGEKVENPQDLTAKITVVPVGDEAKITFLREGKSKSTSARVAERPTSLASSGRGVPGAHPSAPGKSNSKREAMEEYGLVAEELTEQNARELGLPYAELKSEHHIVVTDIAYGKAAAQSGLNRGDLVLDVAGKEVSTVAQLEAALKSSKSKSLMMRVKRFDRQGSSFVSVVILSK